MNKRTVNIEEAGVSVSFDVYRFGTGDAGPRIFITGGVHGNEYTGIYTAYRLIDFLKENPPLAGSVRVIPVVNASAMRCMRRTSPYDSVDLNRVFPGNNDSGESVSMKLAAAVYEETADAQVIVDLHCCGANGLPYILSIYDECEKARELASRITLPIALRSQGTAGQLFTESCRKRDQAALIIELPSGVGSGAVNAPVSDECFRALIDMLRSYGVASGAVQGEAPCFYGEMEDILAPCAGLWKACVQRGQSVRAGETIGDVDGVALRAGQDCLILSILPCGYVMPGELDVGSYIVPVGAK